MKKIIKAFSFVFIMATFFSACSFESVNTQVMPTTSTVGASSAEVSPNLNPSRMPTAQSTVTKPVLPAQKSTPTDSPTTILEIETGERIPICTEGKVKPQNVGDLELPGTMILYNKGSKELYALDGSTLNRRILEPLEEENNFSFGLSLDGNWLAYSPVEQTEEGLATFQDPKIILLGSDGERIEKTIDLSWVESIGKPGYHMTGFVLGNWLENNLLYAVVNSKIEPDRPEIGLYYPVIIDPFAGLVVETEMIEQLFKPDGLYILKFSPDLKHVIHETQGITLTQIIDMSKSRLWFDKEASFIGLGIVEWSPDGAWAVFTSDNTSDMTISLISEDGQEMKKFEAFNHDMVKSFFWSADSNFLAFPTWNRDSGDTVYLFDNANNQFLLKCPLMSEYYLVDNLYWSPDGKWVAITQDGKPMQLLNVVSGIIYEFQTEDTMIGWSDKQSWGENK